MTALSHSWLRNIDLKLIAEQVGTPVFIYSEAQFRKNLTRVRRAADEAGIGDRVEFYIPFFPNSNPHHLAPLKELDGFGVLVQLPSEYRILRAHGFEKFIVSPGHVSNEEISFWDNTRCPTFLASLDEVAHSLTTEAPAISVRIDSLDSGKPGVKYGELDRLTALLKEHGRELDCVEVYCGSGNSLDDMVRTVEEMFEVFQRHFPTARAINFAGGHGFDYDAHAEEDKHFDWPRYFARLAEAARRMGIPEHVRFLFEPARDVLADTGALLMSVERSVITTPVSSLVVTDGCRMLMPSAQLRNRGHNTAFLDGNMREIVSEKGVSAAVRGRTILRNDYLLPGEVHVPEGVDASSYLVILDTGAYCATQHMEFLNVPPAAEVLVNSDGSMDLITSAGDELDKWRNLLSEKQPVKG
ncbi:diaminopimelate decarboxylase [Streptomyces sp. NRRL F-4489]|uniref:diaminopimelate decarboxylase n=1 Tax=Streptomyces sp. NRRL F-4489 TaxID=1609095 RepID=UPI00074619ED|nr:diaminopimelate decarboxylase [Streptomyces sp. NRRL F-4489]KUL36080.1 diaminopimelate decarboxylase [Streptomyces sp. NRRL F-4489]